MRLLCSVLILASLHLSANAQCTYQTGWPKWSVSAPTGTYYINDGLTEWNDKSSVSFSGILYIGGPGPTNTTGGTLYFDCSMSTSLTCDEIRILQGGRLEVGALASGKTVHITCNKITVESGGVFQVGTTSSRPVGDVVITLTGSDKVFQVMPGGTLELHGSTYGATGNCWTQLGLTTTNSTSVTLFSPMTWPAGGKLVIASTDLPQITKGNGSTPDAVTLEQTEELVVSTALNNSTALTVNQAPQHQHFGGWVHSNTVDESAEIGLLTRSIRIEATDTSPGGSVVIGSSTSTYTPATVHIDWVEFTNLGNDASNAFLGGYPLHFHMLGDMDGMYVKHCSLHANFHNNLVLHNTKKLTVEDNVMYNTVGWHFWMQETDQVDTNGQRFHCTENIIDHNLASVAKDNGNYTSIGMPFGSEDNAACFYIRNFDNTIKSNHAGSSEVHGFYVDTAEHYSTGTKWTQPHEFHNGESFVGNVAHSCGASGFYMEGFLRFEVRQPGSTTFPPPMFSNFTAYKNTGYGVHCRVWWGTVVWDNAMLADNGSGVYFAAGRHGYEAVQLMQNSFMVGESTNTGVPPATGLTRAYPTARSLQGALFPYIAGRFAVGTEPAFDGELTGVSLYDGLTLLDNIDFADFVKSAQPPKTGSYPWHRPFAGAIGLAAYKNPWMMEPNNAIRGCTFGGSDNAMYFRDELSGFSGNNHGILYDVDNCVIGLGGGSGGGVVFPQANTILEQAGWAGIGMEDWNCKIIDGGGNPFAQAQLFSGGRGQSGGPGDTVTVTYGSGSTVVTSPEALTASYYFQPWNTFANTSPPSSSGANVVAYANNGKALYGTTVMLSANVAGSMADFVIPYYGPSTEAYKAGSYEEAQSHTGGATVPMKSSLSAWQSSANVSTSWFLDETNQLLYVRLVLPQSGVLQTYLAGWGGVFTGAPEYLTFFLPPW